jgi:hypothetical protein
VVVIAGVSPTAVVVVTPWVGTSGVSPPAGGATIELLSAASGTLLLLAIPVEALPVGAAGVGFKGMYEGQSPII